MDVVTTRYTRPVPFEELEHTADAAVRVRGRSAEETLARLVLAFSALVTGGEAVVVEETRHIEIEPSDLAAQAVDLLRELLFELDAHGFVPEACAIERLSLDGGARVVVEFGRYDAARHGEGLILKAVTWHDARFEREEGDDVAEPWWAQIVFDV